MGEREAARAIQGEGAAPEGWRGVYATGAVGAKCGVELAELGLARALVACARGLAGGGAGVAGRASEGEVEQARRRAFDPKAGRVASHELGREACGVLFGRPSEPGRWVWTHSAELPNIAVGTDRFTLDPGAWVRADALARAHGLAVLGFWHTHAGSPRPSAADTRAAWPGSLHVIASARGSVRVWRRHAGAT